MVGVVSKQAQHRTAGWVGHGGVGKATQAEHVEQSPGNRLLLPNGCLPVQQIATEGGGVALPLIGAEHP